MSALTNYVKAEHRSCPSGGAMWQEGVPLVSIPTCDDRRSDDAGMYQRRPRCWWVRKRRFGGRTLSGFGPITSRRSPPGFAFSLRQGASGGSFRVRGAPGIVARGLRMMARRAFHLLGNKGFTLVEVMIAILIMAVLLGSRYLTLIGARRGRRRGRAVVSSDR